MVQIRYLTKGGDSTQQLELESARELVKQELDKGNLVFDEDERAIVTKATMGAIKEDSHIGVFPKVAGG